MLETIKIAMGISHDMLDEALALNIQASLIDLKRVGVKIADETDPLIIKAVELYCKWQLNYSGLGERFERAYSNLANALALCGDYL